MTDEKYIIAYDVIHTHTHTPDYVISEMLFNFVLEYTIGKILTKQCRSIKINGIHQILAHDDDVSLIGGDFNIRTRT